MPKEQSKECPHCGKPFVCSMNSHCWCFEVIIPFDVQDYIAARYDDCICRDCICEIIKNKALRE